MNKSMPNSKANISISDFKELYLEQSKPRSIRRLHQQLKNKFPQRKIISLATIFRHSNSEKWKEQTVNLDSQISEKILEKNVNKKVKEYDNLAQQLELTSTKAMQSVLDAFSKGIGDEIKKPGQILSLVKASVESHKLLNTINGLPSSISGHISYDSSNVEALKNHIQELYASINMDLMKRQKQKDLVQEEIEYRNKKLN